MGSSQPSLSLNHDGEQNNCFVRASAGIRHVMVDMALDTVIEVGVFNVLAEAGCGERKLSAKEITAELRIDNPNAPKMVDAFLSLVACYGLVGCSLGPVGERVYSLNALSKYFLPQQGVSLKPMLAMSLHRSSWAAMREAKNAILEGGVPFERANGMSLYAYTNKDETMNELFSATMSSNSTAVINNLLGAYDGFKGLNTLVDVGGSSGTTLGMITSKYPSLKGINFDLPSVVQQAPSYTGVEHIGGDFLEGVPKGDAILLKMILHNWSDDQCIKLLKNCYDSIPNGGKVIVVETIIPGMPDTSDSTRLSFLDNAAMSLLFDQGQERTLDEYKVLASKAGFNGTMRSQELTDCVFWVMEFFK